MRARTTSDRVRAEKSFSIRDCLQRAEDTFAFPPTKPHIERPEPQGQLVATFVLPLELCPTTNLTRHGQVWKLKKLKTQVYAMLWSQWVHHRAERVDVRIPLPGRPQVLCTRFVAGEGPDAYSDWAKIAVDKLCVGPERLGILVDDKPSCVDLRQWSEPAPRNAGFCLFRIYSGRVSVI